MGTAASITVVGGTEDDAYAARAHVELCERRWSRFLPASELARMNRAAGLPVLLPRDTYELVAGAVECWSLSAGLFDPTVLRALEAAGYDDSFERASRTARPTTRSPGCGGIVLDDELGAVTLPHGVALDLGGIAKGHTADVTATMLLDHGMLGALVNLGGDIRARGVAPTEDGWLIGIADPFDGALDLETVRVADGGVTTSTVLRRRWRDGDVELHHLIDPRTGRPSTSSIVSATIIAETAAWAEVTAKVALIAGPEDAAAIVRAAGATGLLVHADGEVTRLDGLEVYG